MLRSRNKRSWRGSNTRESTRNEDALPIPGTWTPAGKRLNGKKSKPSFMPKRCRNAEKRQKRQDESDSYSTHRLTPSPDPHHQRSCRLMSKEEVK